MTADTIEYATKETEYVDILVARGRRTVKARVKKESLKKYGRLRRKGEVYAKKRRVVTEKGKVVTKAVPREAILDRFFYVPEKRAYKKYEPERTVQVTTTSGQKVVITERQAKTAYRRVGGRYQEKPSMRAEPAPRPRGTAPSQRERRMPARMQMVRKYRITLQDGTVITEIGRSRVTRRDTSSSDMEREALISLRKRLKLYHGIPYDERISVEVMDENMIRWTR